MPLRSHLLLLTFFLTLSLSACQRVPKEHNYTLLVFGTLVNVSFYDIDNKKAEAMISLIRDDLNFMHEAWHPWKPGPMGRTNTLLAQTEWFSANPSVMPLITQGKQLWHQSQGLFNPAIGHLLTLWGYHQETPPQGPPPAKDKIQHWLQQHPTMEDIDIKGIRVRSTNAAVKLDFGAMAKGLAVDRVIRQLKEHGVQHAIVNAGGDLKAIGQHGDRAWRIGIRHPRQDGSVLAAINVKDNESVFTSGDYERFYQYKNKRYHHILDPRTGYPATDTTSVTVIHPQAVVADAAATALFVAGPSQWHEIAQSMKLQYVMLVDKQGHIHLTPAMAERVDWLENKVSTTITSLEAAAEPK